MRIVALRIWRTLGVFGTLGVLFALLVLGVAVADGTSVNAAPQYRVVGTLLLAAVVCGLMWGRYQRPAETSLVADVVEPLIRSRRAYCLLLRPFGADGEVFVPHLPTSGLAMRQVGMLTPTLTLEQVVARAVRRRLGVATYAIVDQRRTLAPPGPVYARAADTEWRDAVRTLVGQAHTIVLLLPPGQDVRTSFAWEVAQIARAGLRSRVVVVLPPPDRYRDAHRAAREQACRILAALDRPDGSLDRADPARYDESLAPDTLLVKACEAHTADDPDVMWWHPTGRRRFRRVAADTYDRSLQEALARAEQERERRRGLRAGGGTR